MHASVVLVTNDEQREAALRSVEKVSEVFSDEVLTRVESVHDFAFIPAPDPTMFASLTVSRMRRAEVKRLAPGLLRAARFFA